VFRADVGPVSPGQALARRAPGGPARARPRAADLATPVTINGAAGALFGTREDPIAVIAFTVADGRIAAIDLIATRTSCPPSLGGSLVPRVSEAVRSDGRAV
jgi:hypothetical protein